MQSPEFTETNPVTDEVRDFYATTDGNFALAATEIGKRVGFHEPVANAAALITVSTATLGDVVSTDDGQLWILLGDGDYSDAENWEQLQLVSDDTSLSGADFSISIATQRAASHTIYGMQNPIAEYDPVSNRTYTCFLGAYRSLYVTYFDHDSGQWQPSVFVATYGITDHYDTHGEPSLCVDGDGYIYVIFGGHDTNQKICRSTNPRDIQSWTVASSGSWNGTYASICYDDVSDAVYVFWRRGPGHGGGTSNHEQGGIMRSVNNGQSWTVLTNAINTIAFSGDSAKDVYASDFDAFDGKLYITFLVAHGASHDGTRSNVYVVCYDPATSTVKTVDGLTSFGATLDTADDWAEPKILAYEGDWINSLRTFVSPEGQVATVFSRGDVDAQRARVSVARWTGTAWAVVDTGITSNFVVNQCGIRINGDELWEVWGIARTGGTYQYDTASSRYAGGDLVRATSPDLINWTVHPPVVGLDRITGGRLHSISVPRDAIDSLAVIVQPSGVVGAPNWRMPLYGIGTQDAPVGSSGASLLPKPDLVERYDDDSIYVIGTESTGVTPVTSFAVVDCTDLVPIGTTEVDLVVSVTPSGTAGKIQLHFIEAGTGRGTDALFSCLVPSGVTDTLPQVVTVPLNPDLEFEWRASATATIAALGVKARIGAIRS
jgi:hypothetical protein